MKTINILINNGTLGRMGKTTLSYTIYKTSKLPFKYATNDLENASIRLEKFVNDDDLIYFKDGEEIDISPQDNIIFDFGGKPDERLLDIAGYVDFVIIPIAFQSISELQLTVKNMNAFLEVNKNIIVIINNTEPADAKLVKLTLGASFPDLTILEINHSKFIRRLANDNQTVFEVAEASKGDATRLNKKIIPQFKELFEHLNINY